MDNRFMGAHTIHDC